jgi:integrase
LGEILGLRWLDVDLNQSHLTIAQALQRQKGRGLVLTETKTDRSRRTIALPVPLIAGLRVHRLHQLEERLATGPAWCDSGLVFTSSVGAPLEPRKLFRSFKAVLDKGGLPNIRFHDLRHSAASLMLAQGIPLRSIQEILGHGSIAMTANLYAHVGEQLKRQAADAMGAILSSR